MQNWWLRTPGLGWDCWAFSLDLGNLGGKYRLSGWSPHTHTHTRGQEVDEAGDAGAERFLKTQLNSSFVWHVKQMSSVLCKKKKKTEISKATAAAESAYEVRKSNNRNCWKQVATIGGPSSELWWLSINVHPSPISRIPHSYAISPQPSSSFSSSSNSEQRRHKKRLKLKLSKDYNQCVRIIPQRYRWDTVASAEIRERTKQWSTSLYRRKI